ncbi:DNA-binding LacI/PurR family transcriptional regulator [Rhizobium leucaenae]|uniref:DNA-binding LacI/PurR family transcriptional regulator n=2 Tax=Rhizobium leucaenae TaxID=29450 RepID=A0A7W6ZW91_9HYPH|nr:DNA-binding LacI/PurR family transcriptional regulator [Rhizobium leucaenae]MBB6302836.1 DNA-binding LacI/PurR family transcriptional regulator [Rhizobium leucaenae]
MPKPIKTMEDFSEFVGLSRPTVSKYFNDPSSVRKKTRETIEVALKKSGFRPNLFAVNLNRRRTNIVGIIIPSSIDPFYMALTRRIEALATEAGFFPLVLSTDGQSDLEDRAIRTLKSLNVAGAIIAPLGVESHQRTLAEYGRSVPLVYVDSPLDDTSAFVGTDNEQSFRLIVDYLCRSGEPPSYLGMPDVNTNARTRENAYLDAMAQFGMTPHVLPVPKVRTWDFERFGFEETMRLAGGPNGLPTKTILCANDRIAFGAIAAAYKLGLKVGHGSNANIRIAGHDDHPLSRYACPPITTVAQNVSEIGERAVNMLLAMLGEADSERENFSPTGRFLLSGDLMLRESA